MLGTEIDLKAKIKAFDKLTVLPYFATLLPGKALSMSDDTDMQMKFGVTFKTNL